MSDERALAIPINIFTIYCNLPIYICPLARDVALKTCQRRWTIGRSGERGSGISVLAARHDDDDDIYIYIYICIYRDLPDIGLGVRGFANGPGDLGSIPGRVIPKTQKMVLDASLLNTQHYKVRIKGKVEQSREGVAPSPTHWCSSYRKGSLRVTLDYGRQLYFYLYI